MLRRSRSGAGFAAGRSARRRENANVDRLQIRVHALADELSALNREQLRIEAADVADKRLVLDYIGDVRGELDLLE
jgi:hypothetical protein